MAEVAEGRAWFKVLLDKSDVARLRRRAVRLSEREGKVISWAEVVRRIVKGTIYES